MGYSILVDDTSKFPDCLIKLHRSSPPVKWVGLFFFHFAPKAHHFSCWIPLEDEKSGSVHLCSLFSLKIKLSIASFARTFLI